MPDGNRWVLCYEHNICLDRRDHILGLHTEEGAVARGVAGEELEDRTWWWVSEGRDRDWMIELAAD